MDISTNSVVDFEVHIDANDMMNGTASDGPTPDPQPAAIHAVATIAEPVMADAAAYVTAGVAPGDGDLIPPRFTGERKTDAEEWIQDLLDSIEIRRVPKSIAAVLLRTRLSGVARKWLESVPPGTDFDETVRRFRNRFGANDGARTELLTEFWHRRQAADEPVGTYIEQMASLARRMKFDNEPLMRQGIIQGLRPEIKRDVMIQRPTTLEALAEAAAIGEANARDTSTGAKTTDAAISAQLAEMRAMMAVMQDVVAAGQRPHRGVNAVETPATLSEQPSVTATAARAQNNAATATASAITTPADPRNVTIQLMMPNTAASQYGGEFKGNGGRPGRSPARPG